LNPEEAILFVTPFLLFLNGNSTLYSKESSKVSNPIQVGPEGSFITSNFINIYILEGLGGSRLLGPIKGLPGRS
jgi:hypothetical protein